MRNFQEKWWKDGKIHGKMMGSMGSLNLDFMKKDDDRITVIVHGMHWDIHGTLVMKHGRPINP